MVAVRDDRPALLFLTQRIPYPPNKGEKIPAYHFLRHLCGRYRVHLGAFIDDPADEPGIAALEAMVESLCIVRLKPRQHWLGTSWRWLHGLPVSYAKFRSGRLGAYVDGVLAREQPAVIFAQSSNVATYAVDRAVPGRRAATLLHFIDVDSAKFAAYAALGTGPKKWIFDLEARRVAREEARLATLADAVTLISADEAALFRTVHGDGVGKVSVLANGVDTASFDPALPAPSPFDGTGPHFVFTGAMDYAPNIQAVQWFSQQVMPGLIAALPTSRFWIVGSNPVREVRALGDLPGITVTGRVEAVVPYLRHATACVAPLQIARGVQNKVLEAMAMARPVIASPDALTGIALGDPLDGDTPVSVARTPKEWIARCRWAATAPDDANRLGLAARQFVEAHFSWQAQFAVLESLIAASGGTRQT